MYEIDLSKNKYVLGITMIIINIGSRFLLDELTPKQKKFINKPLIRRVTIFCIFYMATKDCIASLVLTGFFIIFIGDILKDDDPEIKEKNEEHQKILNEIEIVLSKYSK
tara:strand:+ start:2299 stop:2625 length:327 start_codon:yes stop_codon:yes gene_type:complete